MTLAFVSNDWHLGRSHQSVDLDAELLHYVKWLCSEARDFPSLDDRILIVAGDTFDPKKSLTIDQNKLFKKILKELTNAFDRIYFVLGNHDVPGRKVLDDDLFQFFELPSNVVVVRKVETIVMGKTDISMFPYGMTVPGRPGIYITHEIIERLQGIDNQILNGHIHTWSKNGNIHQLGTPYQLEASNAGNPGGYVIIDDSGNDQEIARVSYPRKTFLRVRLEAGKIDGKNPVKWITENREALKGSCLEVSVDEGVDKTLYSKFVGVLATVDLAELKMVDDISFTTDQPLSDSKPNFSKSLMPLISRDGAKLKIEAILNEIGA